MSYNIDSVQIVTGFLTIESSLARKFAKDKGKYEMSQVPEDNFLDDVLIDDGEIKIDNPEWSGEGSGRSFDLFKEVLGLTKGTADLVLTWEGGDSITGLRITDGLVEEKKVRMVLE